MEFPEQEVAQVGEVQLASCGGEWNHLAVWFFIPTPAPSATLYMGGWKLVELLFEANICRLYLSIKQIQCGPSQTKTEAKLYPILRLSENCPQKSETMAQASQPATSPVVEGVGISNKAPAVNIEYVLEMPARRLWRSISYEDSRLVEFHREKTITSGLYLGGRVHRRRQGRRRSDLS